MTLDSLRETVGVVTQDAHLFHDTIRANLAYARPDATEAEMEGVLRSAQIWDLVVGAAAGAGHRRRRPRPPALRRGEAAAGHRPAAAEVARAWSSWTRRPRTWTASPRSPCSGRWTRRSSGRTALVIAHRLSTVRGADLIVVVDDGRIVETGRHDELLAAGGLYADLYTTQFASQGLRPTADDSLDPRALAVLPPGRHAPPRTVI